MTDTAVIAAAHAIERCGMFRRVFHPTEPPGANTHPAALEFARAALGATPQRTAMTVTAEADAVARFAEARKRLGWSLRDAERASGVPNAHISQIETGAIMNPGPAVVVKLAKAYGMEDLIPAIPQVAITAAAEAIAAQRRHHWDVDFCEVQALATAVLAAAAPHLAGDGWDAARDRATEANEARRAERERCAQLADELKAAVAVEGDWSTLLPFGGLLRAQPPQCGSCNHEPGDPRVRVICECPCHGLTSPHPEEGTTDAATA